MMRVSRRALWRLYAGALLLGIATTVAFAACVLRAFPSHALRRYPAGTCIYDRNGQLLRAALGPGDVRCVPVSLDQMGDWALPALVAAEDKRFFAHRGVDPLAIARAARLNLLLGRTVSGASTLSMQLIRMLQPRPRTIRTKLIESIHALALEHHCSKSNIIEHYLNRAPFGANLAGIEAAAWYYFGIHARDLSLGQTALLIGVLQAPSRWRPDRHLARARLRQRYVLERMRACGMISDAQLADTLAQPIAIRRAAQPFLAPHFSELVLQRAHPPGAVIASSLDLPLQLHMEAAAREYLRTLQSRGINALALVVIHVPSNELRALVSLPTFGTQPAGCVNHATALRSPGSALKPFLYALAFDRGIATPETVLADIPARFDDYTPHNADHTFRGLVSARNALVDSLNLPAVELMRRIGVPVFIATLQQCGIHSLTKPPDSYGLSAAIGTLEVSLLDVANAYACLARGGLALPLHLCPAASSKNGIRVFSPEAAWLVSDCLAGDERALPITGHAADAVLPRCAIKTGTSSGMRDAWAIAYNPEYVVAVWAGNSDGSPAPDLAALDIAAPFAAARFRDLYPRGDAPWFQPPAGIAYRDVCAASGLPASSCCPRTRRAAYIRGVSSPAPCSVHQRAPDGSIVERWPAPIAAFLARAGRPAPPVAPDACLTIVSPQPGATYLAANHDASLRLSATGSDTELFWFLNGELVAHGCNDQRIPWPASRGAHDIVCADAHGRAARAVIHLH